jgi:membrane-associated phospholipid phosphatase
LPVICALILSTLYLRYHYVIDLLVGMTLAMLCMIFGPLLHRWWNAESGTQSVESGI